MKQLFQVVSILAACVVGCSGSPAVSVEANDLGIASVEIDRTTDSGDHVLLIRGLDVNGDEKGLVTLRTGVVYVDSDWAAPGWTTGSDLKIEAGDQRFAQTTPGLQPHTTPTPIQSELAGFVHLRAVATAIEQDAGIRFADQRASGEAAFNAADCDTNTFNYYKYDGTVLGNSSECCQDGTQQYFKIAANNKLGTRQLSTACRTSGGSTCTGLDCYYGPCGANAWGATGNANATVFTPNSLPTRCGFDDNGTDPGGSNWPELYTNQAVKPGVTATCGYTWCVTGTPTQGDKSLALTVASDLPTGSVGTSSGSYTISGQSMGVGSYTGYYFGGGAGGNPPANEVILTANVPSTGQVTWTGACTGHGTSCTIWTTAATSVTATFGCPAGKSDCCGTGTCMTPLACQHAGC